MKAQIKKMILEAREKQNKKIQIMQKLAEKHSRETKSQSESIRIKIAAETLESYGKGDASLCYKSENLTREKMDEYCDLKFNDDIQQNQNCKVFPLIQIDKDFCYLCCQKEFGLMRVSERKSCFDSCPKEPLPELVLPSIH